MRGRTGTPAREEGEARAELHAEVLVLGAGIAGIHAGEPIAEVAEATITDLYVPLKRR